MVDGVARWPKVIGLQQLEAKKRLANGTTAADNNTRQQGSYCSGGCLVILTVVGLLVMLEVKVLVLALLWCC